MIARRLSNIPEPANFEQSQIYYWVSTVLLWAAIILTGITVYEWRHNKAYHRDMFKGFIPIYMGNVGFILAYLPFHTYNAFNAAINGENATFYEEGPICAVQGFFGPMLFMMYSWVGMTLVAYSLHEAVRRAMSGQNATGTIMTKKILWGSFLLPFVLTTIYFFIDKKDIGPYRNLYCLWDNWNPINSSYGIVYWTCCAILMCWFYYHTYLMLHGHFKTMRTSATNGKETIRNTIILSAKFCFVFFVCGLPIFIEVCWSVSGGDVPIIFSMVAGWLFKLKCGLDAIILLTMPSIKKGREEVRKMTLTAKAKREGTGTLSRGTGGTGTVGMKSVVADSANSTV